MVNTHRGNVLLFFRKKFGPGDNIPDGDFSGVEYEGEIDMKRKLEKGGVVVEVLVMMAIIAVLTAGLYISVEKARVWDHNSSFYKALQ
jgi:hypothetical protein